MKYQYLVTVYTDSQQRADDLMAACFDPDVPETEMVEYDHYQAPALDVVDQAHEERFMGDPDYDDTDLL